MPDKVDINDLIAESPIDLSGDPVVQSEVDLLCLISDFPDAIAEIAPNIPDNMISNSAVGKLIKAVLRGEQQLTASVIEETVNNQVYNVKRSCFSISDVTKTVEALIAHYKLRFFTKKLPQSLLGSKSLVDAVDHINDAYSIALTGLAKYEVKDKKAYTQDFMSYISNKEDIYRTGIQTIDSRITAKGITLSQLITVAADTGVGKTLLVVQLLEHIANMYNVPCCLFSLEMPLNQMLSRRIVHYLNGCITTEQLIRKEIPDEAFLEVENAAVQMAKTPIYIKDNLHCYNDIANTIRTMSTKGFKFFVIDLLQLIRIPGSKLSERERIDYITADLKIIANKYKVTIFLVSHLHRKDDIKMKTNGTIIQREPTLGDLKGASGIEQNSDKVMMLWSPESVNPKDNNPNPYRYLKFGLKKDRFGVEFGVWLKHNLMSGILECCSDQDVAYIKSMMDLQQSKPPTTFKEYKNTTNERNN